MGDRFAEMRSHDIVNLKAILLTGIYCCACIELSDFQFTNTNVYLAQFSNSVLKDEYLFCNVSVVVTTPPIAKKHHIFLLIIIIIIKNIMFARKPYHDVINLIWLAMKYMRKKTILLLS